MVDILTYKNELVKKRSVHELGHHLVSAIQSLTMEHTEEWPWLLVITVITYNCFSLWDYSDYT